MVGDDLHVQEPKDEQRESDHADECEHHQDKARQSVGRKVSRATWQPPAFRGRSRFVSHPMRILRRGARLWLGLAEAARGAYAAAIAGLGVVGVLFASSDGRPTEPLRQSPDALQASIVRKGS